MRWTQEQYEQYLATLKSYRESENSDVPDEGRESKLQKLIEDWAREQGYPCWHDRSRKKNQPGWPDTILFLPNSRVVLMELKSKRGRLTKEQRHFRLIFHHLGHEWYKIQSFIGFMRVINNERGE